MSYGRGLNMAALPDVGSRSDQSSDAVSEEEETEGGTEGEDGMLPIYVRLLQEFSVCS